LTRLSAAVDVHDMVQGPHRAPKHSQRYCLSIPSLSSDQSSLCPYFRCCRTDCKGSRVICTVATLGEADQLFQQTMRKISNHPRSKPPHDSGGIVVFGNPRMPSMEQNDVERVFNNHSAWWYSRIIGSVLEIAQEHAQNAKH